MRQINIFIFVFNLLFFCLSTDAVANDGFLSNENIQLEIPTIIMTDVEYELEFIIENDVLSHKKEGQSELFFINGKEFYGEWKKGALSFPYLFEEEVTLSFSIGSFHEIRKINPIPLWLSLLPPLIAILFALLFKEVFTALFVGILFGTTTICYYQGASIFGAFLQGVIIIPEKYILESMNSTTHLSIIIFSMLIGGMVNIITRNGGMRGVVNFLSRFAKTPRSGQFITWLLGILIFFDDYANTLVVGNTMRPVTDRLRISREKLAYLVDSTAAPVAAIAFVTTWIGAELSYIQDGINTIGIDESPYTVFIQSLAYSFYPIFALVFMLILIFLKRDFGLMHTIEKRTRKSGIENDESGFSNNLNDLSAKENIPTRGINAVFPVLVIIIGTIVGLLITGWDSSVWNDNSIGFLRKMSHIIGNADSFKALLWSSASGLLVAFALTLSQRLLSLKESIDSMINGFRTMLTAILILILAWSIALVTEHLHTADFISNTLVSTQMSPYFLPFFTFLLAAMVAFSTGSSWGTMAVLYPLILPATWLVCKESGMDHETSMSIFHNVVSAVLAGSVLGDHCSPISDTTIMSSLASSCNHISHVRTQMPYALTVGGVALIAGTLPAAFGVSSWILMPFGFLILFLIVKFFGKIVD